MLAFSGCFKNFESKNIWFIIIIIGLDITEVFSVSHVDSLYCDFVHAVTLLLRELWFKFTLFSFCIFVICGANTVLCDDVFSFMLGGSCVFRCIMSFLNFSPHFCPYFHTKQMFFYPWIISIYLENIFNWLYTQWFLLDNSESKMKVNGNMSLSQIWGHLSLPKISLIYIFCI